MSAFGLDAFGTATEVKVEVYTAAYRINGTVSTRFGRVAEILNQLSGGHLSVSDATIVEHVDPDGGVAAPTAVVPVDEILVMLAPDLVSQGRDDMRIQKRPVPAEVSIPPLRLVGTIHVPLGSRPIDGLLNVPDRFMPMTDATITSAAHSHLDRAAGVLAMRRDRAHVLVVTDDEPEDEPADATQQPTPQP